MSSQSQLHFEIFDLACSQVESSSIQIIIMIWIDLSKSRGRVFHTFAFHVNFKYNRIGEIQMKW